MDNRACSLAFSRSMDARFHVEKSNVDALEHRIRGAFGCFTGSVATVA
jgi:hypothetical protein